MNAKEQDFTQQSPYPTDAPLSPAEQAHSMRLLARIHEEIGRSGGWIGFARYMELALYEPGLGYYSAGATKLGPAGDFVTAPELSPLFSRCLAGQCRDVLESLGGGDILELGAGSGVMAADILVELETLGVLPRRYFILEVSADLRQRQKATLAARVPRLLERVEWLEALPGSVKGGRKSAPTTTPVAAPPAIKGVILANEVMDAIPVERFRIRGAGEKKPEATAVNALGVTSHLGRLEWSETRASAALTAAVREIERDLGEPLPEGYTSEVNLRLPAWIHGLGEALEQGAILLVDYGLPRRQYYSPERCDGTLLCHFRHRFNHDPLSNVGLQDIGAWVDFTAVAQAAVDAQLAVAGFATQAHFLMGLGIERYLMEHDKEQGGQGEHKEAGDEHKEQGDALAQRLRLARQAMVLTLPGEMGERFKAIGLTKRFDRTLRGFSIRDLAASL